MTILTLRYNEKNLKDYALVRGQHLTIGRNPDNDIVIENAAVSGYHARIESVVSSFVIRDLKSTNGVFVNKQRIETHALQHNDIVRVGKHELVFNRLVFDRSVRVDKSRPVDEDFIDDKTRFLDTREHRAVIQESTGKEIPTTSKLESENITDNKKDFFLKLWKKILR